MKLSETEKNIKICERLGWAWFRREMSDGFVRHDFLKPASQEFFLSEGWVRIDAPPIDGFKDASTVPNHFACLNAIHEAEKVLSFDQKQTYRSWLYSMADKDGYLFATASQRSEALGLTCGLWEDGE